MRPIDFRSTAVDVSFEQQLIEPWPRLLAQYLIPSRLEQFDPITTFASCQSVKCQRRDRSIVFLHTMSLTLHDRSTKTALTVLIGGSCSQVGRRKTQSDLYELTPYT